MSTSVVTQFETGHADAVNDAAFDYYGKRLATCSSDHGIKIFDVIGDQVTHLADLVGHQGPVWEVSWAHPKFGSLLASAGSDGTVSIWREASENAWQRVHVAQMHSASVNAVSWAPHELGLMLAAASSDGSASVLTCGPDGAWTASSIPDAHPAGVCAVSWAPAAPPGALLLAQSASGNAPAPVCRLTTGGCDAAVKVWALDPARGQWRLDGAPLGAHTDWVRDVAWAPGLGLPQAPIASAGQDGRVIVWSEGSDGTWSPTPLHSFGVPVWRLSWSVSGNVLAVSDASGETTLWKEGPDGVWLQLQQ